ncbi:hypothetical protein GDO78_014970 [Eleutherodactylus coqui]|uniref:Uncharacterized protein n=1 Tax=Eleutherodactylus coqui TaxID=57060 RepID=A0A8J6EE37_ELECQ|nr:hypothetical protein GDO78_014970 [Eleutherodactylus coqui]
MDLSGVSGAWDAWPGVLHWQPRGYCYLYQKKPTKHLVLSSCFRNGSQKVSPAPPAGAAAILLARDLFYLVFSSGGIALKGVVPQLTSP